MEGAGAGYGFNPIEITSELDATPNAASEPVPVEYLRHGVKVFYEVGGTANPS